MSTDEISAKKLLLQSLLRCPHRDLKETAPVFSQALERDPMFAGRCFFALTLPEFNRIRDLADSGIAFLLTSPWPEHRRAGRILFQGLEPYRAYRAGRFIRNDLRKVNRQVKGAVEDYLRGLESNKVRFDRAVMLAGKSIHHLYEFFHIKPSPRAQTIIFEGKTPEGEVDMVKLLRKARTPEQQAEVIAKHKVPMRLATSVLKGLTPAVWVALIEVMTPVEAMNARASVERSGILKDERIRKLYEEKLEAAGTAEKVSPAQLAERKSARGMDERIEEIIQKTRQEKIEKGAKITVDTLICTDISGSMEVAVEVAKRLGPMVASTCEAQLKIYCFNDTSFEVKVEGKTLQDFEKAFRMIKADGATCLGIPLKMCIKQGFVPEQAVYITDQGENRRPYLVDVYQELLSKGIDPRFIFITLRGFDQTNKVVRALENAGADVMDYKMEAMVGEPMWWAEMENVLPLLTKGGYLELVSRILQLELPK